MSESIAQAMYSVPITRRVGSDESLIPEEYRARTPASSQTQVRCGLFPGENMVKVTWGGPEEAQLICKVDEADQSYHVGSVPAGGGARTKLFTVPARSPEDYVYVRFPTVASVQGDATGAITVIGMDAS